MNSHHTKIIEIRIPLEEPHISTLKKVRAFRYGQQDRKTGQPCRSAEGSYLDGWYSPEKEVPPYVTPAQVRAFDL